MTSVEPTETARVSAPRAEPIVCPFCGAALTDRVMIDGAQFLVFRCMFTPQVAREVSDDDLPAYLRTEFGTDGAGYFRSTCDRLHLFVTRPETAGD